MAYIREVPLEYDDLPAHLREAVDYWRTLKGKRVGPSWREVDMLQLPYQLLPTTVVVDCVEEMGSPVYRYRYYGSGLRNLHGVELTGKTPMDLPVQSLAERIVSGFESVRSTKAPVFSVYGAEEMDGFGDFLNVVRLPLADHSNEVTKILGIIRYTKNDLGLNEVFKKIQIREDFG